MAAASIGGIIGVALGASIGFLLVASALVFISLRVKGQKLRAQGSYGRSEKRLSVRTSLHMRLDNEDVARLPTTRPSLRQSFQRPYARMAPYTPMASRLEAKSAGAVRIQSPSNEPGSSIFEDSTPSVASSEKDSKRLPLVRRLTERNVSSRMKRVASNSKAGLSGSKNSRYDLSSQSTDDLTRLEASTPTKSVCDFEKSPAASPQLPELVLPPAITLLPKPLFHTQHRSMSQSALPELERQMASFNTTAPVTDSRSTISTGHVRPMPRSSSLWTQHPGNAPTRPPPILPIEGAIQSLTRTKSLQRLHSRPSSEVFGDRADLTVPTVTTRSGPIDAPGIHPVPFVLTKPPQIARQTHFRSRTANDLSGADSRAVRIDADIQPPVSPALPPPILQSQSHLDVRRSQRVSLQESLPRSNSSGISKYIGYSWSENASRSSISHMPSDSKIDTIKNVPLPNATLADRRQQSRAVSPLSGFVSETQGKSDAQPRPASASMIQEESKLEDINATNVHKNESRSSRTSRPSSLPATDPFEWDAETRSALQSQRRGSARWSKSQRRPDSSRWSATELKPSDTIAERDEQVSGGSTQRRNLRQIPEKSRRRLLAMRPPSTADFNPQMTRLSASIGKSLTENAPATMTTSDSYSPTLSMCNLYSNGSSPETSPVATPSHKPRHPNRVNAIFESPTIPTWPLQTKFQDTLDKSSQPMTADSASKLHPAQQSALQEEYNVDGAERSRIELLSDSHEALIDTLDMDSASVRMSASPSKFPMPPKRHPSHTIPARHRSKIQFRKGSPGMTASGSRSSLKGLRYSIAGRSPKQSSPRLSPSPGSPQERRRSGRLGSSIMALRRLNSEANDMTIDDKSRTAQHDRDSKQYLMLSGNDDDQLDQAKIVPGSANLDLPSRAPKMDTSQSAFAMTSNNLGLQDNFESLHGSLTHSINRSLSTPFIAVDSDAGEPEKVALHGVAKAPPQLSSSPKIVLQTAHGDKNTAPLQDITNNNQRIVSHGKGVKKTLDPPLDMAPSSNTTPKFSPLTHSMSPAGIDSRAPAEQSPTRNVVPPTGVLGLSLAGKRESGLAGPQAMPFFDTIAMGTLSGEQENVVPLDKAETISNKGNAISQRFNMSGLGESMGVPMPRESIYDERGFLRE